MKSYPISKLIKHLPKNYESFCYNKNTGMLLFVMPVPKDFVEDDPNKTITVFINVLTGQSWWKGNDVATKGDYREEFENIEDFKEAMRLLTEDFEYWTDNYDEEALYND